jgi:hypothetical protein
MVVKRKTSMRNLLFLAAGLLALAAPLSGCRSMVEAMGYTVVDEELAEICAVRDDATQKYVDATFPLLKDGFEGEKLLEMEDLARTLKRVSRKERELIARDLEEDDG